jgi:hypothetical protein
MLSVSVEFNKDAYQYDFLIISELQIKSFLKIAKFIKYFCWLKTDLLINKAGLGRF